MSTASKIGYGTVLSRGDDASPTVYTRIAEVRKIGEFGSERGLIDMTNFDSPDGFMEYLLAMKDGVELPLECNFLPANATQDDDTGLIAQHNSGESQPFRMALPTGFGTFYFTALVRAWKANVAPNEGLIATFTLKLTGAITYVP